MADEGVQSADDDAPASYYRRFEKRFADASEEYAAGVTRVALGVVFIWFGAQKPLFPGRSPVHRPVAAFTSALGLGALPGPIGILSHAVGVYEVALGTLILFSFLRAATPLFLVHQAVTLIASLLVMDEAFRRPYLDLGPVAIPLLVDWFSAFAYKNLVFIGAFMFLVAARRDRPDAPSPG